MKKFDAVQMDMFDDSEVGSVEKKAERKIKNRIRAKKSAATKERKKHEEKIKELRRFEKEHPESILFKDEEVIR
jgi:hypothetical protein